MTTKQGIDQAKVEAFMGKAMTDVVSAVATVMASIGDRLGLFKELAKGRVNASLCLLNTRPCSPRKVALSSSALPISY
jgi:hypothetical protein